VGVVSAVVVGYLGFLLVVFIVWRLVGPQSAQRHDDVTGSRDTQRGKLSSRRRWSPTFGASRAASLGAQGRLRPWLATGTFNGVPYTLKRRHRAEGIEYIVERPTQPATTAVSSTLWFVGFLCRR